jgi:hypothetical protein
VLLQLHGGSLGCCRVKKNALVGNEMPTFGSHSANPRFCVCADADAREERDNTATASNQHFDTLFLQQRTSCSSSQQQETAT